MIINVTFKYISTHSFKHPKKWWNRNIYLITFYTLKKITGWKIFFKKARFMCFFLNWLWHSENITGWNIETYLYELTLKSWKKTGWNFFKICLNILKTLQDETMKHICMNWLFISWSIFYKLTITSWKLMGWKDFLKFTEHPENIFIGWIIEKEFI